MTGQLTVFTYQTKSVLPVSDVEIYITDVEKTVLIKKMTTGENGKTEIAKIEAPDINSSLTPDNTLPAFRSVSVYARKEGFFNLLFNGVQVFGERTSILNIMMLPLPENYSGDNTEVVEIPPQNL